MSANGKPDDEPLVSLVVAVFDVADYLEESLQSLLQQDFPGDFEIILVDDCSTDGSLALCRRFAAAHSDRIILIESAVNAGVSAARNRGLERVRGRYLMFVDADDILPPQALAVLFGAAEKYAADIVKGNLVLFDSKQRRPAPDRVRADRLITGDAVLTTLFEHSLVRGHIGGKMFRRDKFGGIRFAGGVRMTEDLLYFSQIFAAADALVLLAAEVYDYRKHATASTATKYAKGSYIDWLSAVEHCGDFATTPRQRRAHKSLLLRSMTQIARECRELPPGRAAPVLDLIEQKCRQWQLRPFRLAVHDRLGLRSMGRYFKLRRALGQIRRNLSRR